MELKSHRQFIIEEYGKIGTEKRDEFERGYEIFKLGVLIQEARKKQGLTQEDLAIRTGMTKGYISKVENDLKDVRFSTLQKILAALGGHVNFSI